MLPIERPSGLRCRGIRRVAAVSRRTCIKNANERGIPLDRCKPRTLKRKTTKNSRKKRRKQQQPSEQTERSRVDETFGRDAQGFVNNSQDRRLFPDVLEVLSARMEDKNGEAEENGREKRKRRMRTKFTVAGRKSLTSHPLSQGFSLQPAVARSPLRVARHAGFSYFLPRLSRIASENAQATHRKSRHNLYTPYFPADFRSLGVESRVARYRDGASRATEPDEGKGLVFHPRERRRPRAAHPSSDSSMPRSDFLFFPFFFLLVLLLPPTTLALSAFGFPPDATLRPRSSAFIILLVTHTHRRPEPERDTEFIPILKDPGCGENPDGGFAALLPARRPREPGCFLRADGARSLR